MSELPWFDCIHTRTHTHTLCLYYISKTQSKTKLDILGTSLNKYSGLCMFVVITIQSCFHSCSFIFYVQHAKCVLALGHLWTVLEL